MNTILCVKWGDKYDDTYVEKLKEQCEKNCTVPFNFYCITDKPTKPYDIKIPAEWDEYYLENRGFFWAYRKYYAFALDCGDNLDIEIETSTDLTSSGSIQLESGVEDFSRIVGDKFLMLDLDVIIHQDLKYFFDLPMDKPWIVRGWWNDIHTVKQNFSKHKSTPLNSSVIRWDRGQLKSVYKDIKKNVEVIFFTYPSADNYFNHRWYNCWEEEKGFFKAFPKGDIYSWYKGNVYPDDMEIKKLRLDHKICLFNNSRETDDVEELKSLWNI